MKDASTSARTFYAVPRTPGPSDNLPFTRSPPHQLNVPTPFHPFDDKPSGLTTARRFRESRFVAIRDGGR